MEARRERAMMETQTHRLTLQSRPKRTVEFTDALRALLRESGLRQGTMVVFCRHTSCSLVIMENADPSARRDLERYLERLVPEGDPAYTHTLEGPDDMPSHIKMALTRTSETIPFADGALLLGTWQGVFLWEHRATEHAREVVVSLVGGFSF
jgi:secondary thiamine-phosphate synthase enzyme